MKKYTKFHHSCRLDIGVFFGIDKIVCLIIFLLAFALACFTLNGQCSPAETMLNQCLFNVGPTS